MRKALVLALAMLAGPAIAGPNDLRFEARGTNPDGSRYGGTAVVTITSNTTCKIVWHVGSESSGICMRNGTTFVAGYVLGKAVGLVIYDIRNDGTMDGKWTIAGQDGVGTELLIPMK